MNERDKELAVQAGFVAYELEDHTESGYDIRYSRFADLIRADEREACAEVCVKQIEKENLLKTGDNQTLSNLLIGHKVTAHMTDARLIIARGDV
jgi:hypothetical protein